MLRASQSSPRARRSSASATPEIAGGCRPTSISTGTKRIPASYFDTNVLLYLVSDDLAKADQAERALVGGGSTSVQVLNELTNVARWKMGMSWTEPLDFLGALRGLLTVHPLTVDVHETGLTLARRHELSIWDAMIVAAAHHADCETLWSEDMQHGLVIAGRLRILDPFRPPT